MKRLASTSLALLLVAGLPLACGGDVGGSPAADDGSSTSRDDGADDGASDDGSSSSDDSASGSSTDDGGNDGSPGSSGSNGSNDGSNGSNGAPGGNDGDPGNDDPMQSQDVEPPELACAQPELGSPALRLLTRLEFENTVNDIFPGIAGQWTTSLPVTLSGYGFDNATGNIVGNQTAETLLETALSVGDAVAGTLSGLLPCASDSPDRACAESFVQQYGRRLFRRPVADGEASRYLALFDSANSTTDFPTAIKYVTAGLIQSPHAIYRSEIGTPNGADRALDNFELATQLAYTFTGSTPSEELLSQAESGNLGDPVTVARAMLDTERGKQMLHRFFELYTGYARTTAKTKPNATTGNISYEDVSAAMTEETRAFIEQVVFTEGDNWSDLLTHPTTNPTQDLANFYGIDAPSGDFASVERPAGKGIGLLAQGSFLATHANPDGSSPTQRGLFVFERMLCQPEPPLPDIVPNLSEPQPGVRTTRQRYEELHAADPACAGCHALFDPMGFAFEHYDEAGRYRDKESGLDIDSTGSVRLPSGTSIDFANLEDLANGLAADATVQECFAAYMAIFAFGSHEACLGSSQVPQLQSGEIGIVDAFAALAGEPHFTRRSP